MVRGEDPCSQAKGGKGGRKEERMSVERGIRVGRSGGGQWKQEGNQSQRHEV